MRRFAKQQPSKQHGHQRIHVGVGGHGGGAGVADEPHVGGEAEQRSEGGQVGRGQPCLVVPRDGRDRRPLFHARAGRQHEQATHDHLHGASHEGVLRLRHGPTHDAAGAPQHAAAQHHQHADQIHVRRTRFGQASADQRGHTQQSDRHADHHAKTWQTALGLHAIEGHHPDRRATHDERRHAGGHLSLQAGAQQAVAAKHHQSAGDRGRAPVPPLAKPLALQSAEHRHDGHQAQPREQESPAAKKHGRNALHRHLHAHIGAAPQQIHGREARDQHDGVVAVAFGH